jgi:nicotinamidase-related amidase
MQRKPDILFFDVDTQNDLIDPSGALPVPGAAGLSSNLARLTRAALTRGVPVIATVLDRQPGDPEIAAAPDDRRIFPPHCLHGTSGQEKPKETALPEARIVEREARSSTDIRGDVDHGEQFLILLKERFDPFRGPNLGRLLDEVRPRRIVVYGVPLDHSVRHTIDGLLERGYTDLALVTDAVAGFDEDRSADLLAAWDDRGLDLVTTDDVLARVGEEVAVRRGE